MNSFRGNRLRDHQLPMSTAWLLNDIAESKGRQDLFSRQSPQVLKALRDAAIIQSVESSNRIEGVTVGRERLHALVLGRSKPRDRSEQEDLERACPGVGREWIRRLLAGLRRSGEVTCNGRGPGARWRLMAKRG